MTIPPLRVRMNRLCGHGGIGRLGGFRFHCESVQVRVLLPAPRKERPRWGRSFLMYEGNRLEPIYMRRGRAPPAAARRSGSSIFAFGENANRVLLPAPRKERPRWGRSFLMYEGNRLEPIYMRRGRAPPAAAGRSGTSIFAFGENANRVLSPAPKRGRLASFFVASPKNSWYTDKKLSRGRKIHGKYL